MKFSRRTFAAGLAVSPLVRARPSPAVQPEAAEKSVVPAFDPQFFDAHQLETVAVIADLIIPRTDTPGARDALVHQHLDKILSENRADVQSAFLEGLWWLDGYSMRVHAHPFLQVNSKVQIAMLRDLSAAASPDLKPGKDFVANAKRWTARIYYSTEIGIAELNKHNRVPPAYSGNCKVS